MKDQTKPTTLPMASTSRFKGHTTITITDTQTGEVEIIEHDNLVTDFSNVLFRPLGVYNMGVLTASVGSYSIAVSDTLWPDPMLDVFGGVMLFQDDMSQRTASDYFLHGGETMVANAVYGVTSNDAVEEMGSFNGAESGWSADHKSYTFVYDFTTNQANGTIRAVCLTSPARAYFGAGNKASGERKETGHSPMDIRNYQGALVDGTPKGFSRYLSPQFIVQGSEVTNYDCLAWLNVSANEIAVFRKTIPAMLAEGKLTIDVYDISLSKMFYLSAPNYRMYNATDQHAIKRTLEFTITQYSDASASGDWWGGYCWRTKGKTYLVAGKRYNDQQCRLYTIDTALETCVESAEFTGRVVGAGNNNTHFWTIDGNELWFFPSGNVDTTATIVKVDLAEGTRTEYTTATMDEAQFYGMARQHIKIGTDIYCQNGIYDGTEYIPANGWYTTSVSQSVIDGMYVGGTACDTEEVVILQANETCTTSTSTSTAGGQVYVLKRNPFWLSTINALENPVTKTSAKTMKVTYTITQEDEEEE